MPESSLKITEREVGDVTILELTGQILLDDGDVEISRRVNALGARGRFRLILDVGGVTYMDSAGVGMLASIVKKLRGSKGDLKLLHLSTKAHKVLGTMKLNLIFDDFDTEEAAIASFDAKN